jgi:hypothetical protein
MIMRPISIFTLTLLAAMSIPSMNAAFINTASAASPCSDVIECLDQNWSEADRAFWYRTSQGSRLIPLAWMKALEEANSGEPFLSPRNIERYGYLSDARSSVNPHGLPVGFVVDYDPKRSADMMCQTFPNICAGRIMRQEWLGLNCSACHTTDIRFGGKTVRVEGAPTLADFQMMLEDLHKSLVATSTDEDKLNRFANQVLGSSHSMGERKTLQAQVMELATYRGQLLEMNNSDVRYGYGRLDAQGHILNKVTYIGKGGQIDQLVKSNAPASYPHIWNTSQQDKIQWNGIAGEIVKLPIFGKTTDVGGLIRNISEVIGVFAHVEINRKWKPDFLGYDSSVRVKEMIDLEQTLEKLGSPLWPENVFGAIDREKAERGREHFLSQKCAQCHEDLEQGDITSPIKVTMSGVEEAGTDVMLACNTLLHMAKAGRYENRKPFIIKGDPIKETDSTTFMLKNAAAGVVIGKLDEVLDSVIGDVIGGFRGAPPDEADTGKQYLPGSSSSDKQVLAKACLTSENASDDATIVAYKARPLNGIWATAPYLHNGSVPTLYDLLLPSHLRTVLKDGETMREPKSTDRPLSFHVGSREFDAERVGFKTDDSPITTFSDGTSLLPFRFDIVDEFGNPIPGNYNSGHEYGSSELSHEERLELVEYLKTL